MALTKITVETLLTVLARLPKEAVVVMASISNPPGRFDALGDGPPGSLCQKTARMTLVIEYPQRLLDDSPL